jgi:hypothetical protein
MALQVGELYASLTLRKGQFDSELNQAKRKMENTGHRFDSIFDGIRTAGLYATAGLAIGFGAAAYAGVKANSDTQQFLATMTKLTGSTEQAKKELQNLKTFAAQTPFEMGDLKQGELIMRAVGLETGKWRIAIGDTAAAWKAAGKNYSDVVQAIADAQTGELERLKEFGITKQQITDKANKMFRNKEIVNNKGQITDLNRFNQALLKLMEDRYGGMMKVQSQTFAGMMSNVKDFGLQALEVLSRPLFDKLNAGAKSAMEGLQELQRNGTLDVWAESIGNDIDSVIEFFQSVNWEAVGMATKFVAVTAAAYGLAAGIRILAIAFAGLNAANIWILAFSGLVGLYSLLSDNTKELSSATIKQTQMQLKQVNANDQLINSYEALRNKTKWTNDEFLRYLDLQTLISKETDTKKVAQYKTEMDTLAKKSGLTNTEINKLLGLNQQMVKQMPQGTKAISEQGNAVARATQNYRALNEQKRQELKMQLETQQTTLLVQRSQLIEKIAAETKKANAADTEAVKIRQQILSADTLLSQTQQNYNKAKEDGNKFDMYYWDHRADQAKVHLNDLNQEYQKEVQIRDESTKGIQNAQGKLDNLKKITGQLTEIYKIEAKTAQDQINKNNQQIAQLQLKKANHKGSTDEINSQIAKLQTENGQLQGTVTKANALGTSLKNAGDKTAQNSKNQGTHNTNLSTGAKNAGNISSNVGKAGDKTKSNIGLANSWNAALGKKILKSVVVTTTEIVRQIANFVTGTGTTGTGNKASKLKRHGGGSIPLRVPGIGGDVPALLKGGETVLTARHTNDLMRRLENGDNRSGNNGPNLNVTVNNNGGNTMDESGVMREAQRAARMLSAWR